MVGVVLAGLWTDRCRFKPGRIWIRICGPRNDGSGWKLLLVLVLELLVPLSLARVFVLFSSLIVQIVRAPFVRLFSSANRLLASLVDGPGSPSISLSCTRALLPRSRLYMDDERVPTISSMPIRGEQEGESPTRDVSGTYTIALCATQLQAAAKYYQDRSRFV